MRRDVLAAVPRKTRPGTYAVLYVLAAAVLIGVHWPLLDMPYFWDEVGLYVPWALDILRSGVVLPHTVGVNVHPPVIPFYLAAVWKLAGVSFTATRVAMLLWAAAGVLFTFLLSLRLLQCPHPAPALLATGLLLASPLFYTQSMLAQLDMPAMVCTLPALLLFLNRRYGAAAIVSAALVLVKETSIAIPLAFGAWLWLRERRWREGAYFFLPAIALFAWVLFLKIQTGNYLGQPEFSAYNTTYALHPVRIVAAFVRRAWYLGIENFHWVGAAAIVRALRKTAVFRNVDWAVTAFVCAVQLVLVSVLGGATLERYLLPVIPILYIAMAAAIASLPKRTAQAASAVLLVGLTAGLFWNPWYPFPFENNLALVDFVRLQQSAGWFLDEFFRGRIVATAWPATAELGNPDLGYTAHRFPVFAIDDFRPSDVERVRESHADVLLVYTRTWEPAAGVLRWAAVADFLHQTYGYEPAVTTRWVSDRLGFVPIVSYTEGGQSISIYARPGVSPDRVERKVSALH